MPPAPSDLARWRPRAAARWKPGWRRCRADRPQGARSSRPMRCTAIAGWPRPSRQGRRLLLHAQGQPGALLADARSLPGESRDGRGRQEAAADGQDRDVAHGRQETRIGIVVEAQDMRAPRFPGFQGVRTHRGARERSTARSTTDVRIFALSRSFSPESCSTRCAPTGRSRTRLHWQLDVTLREDAARNRSDNGPANIAVLRRRALDVARRDTARDRCHQAQTRRLGR